MRSSPVWLQAGVLRSRVTRDLASNDSTGEREEHDCKHDPGGGTRVPYAREVVFDAWTIPDQMSQWRGSPGWHVDPATVTSELKPGGRHHHDKVRESDGQVVGTDAVFTEYFRPDVFVAKQRITGDDGINPDQPLELRVEFTKMGRHGTLVRIIQGPYDPSQSELHSEGWELELERLSQWLQANATPIEGAAR